MSGPIKAIDELLELGLQCMSQMRNIVDVSEYAVAILYQASYRFVERY